MVDADVTPANNRSDSNRRSDKDDGSTCNSFVPGTEVLMADGSNKPIETVRVGDRVWTTDPETGQGSPQSVQGTITGTGAKILVGIHIDGDEIADLVATDEHPIWIQNEQRWIPATDLKARDQLLTSTNDTITVNAVTTHWTPNQTVHNLSVDTTHTYHVAVGDQTVLVHNTDCDNTNAPRTPAQQADDAADEGRSRGAAAQFEVEGHTFVDVSGSDTPLHPAVQDALDTVPDPRKPWHGGCAEFRLVSQALDAAVDPSNGTMTAVQISNGGNVPHGAVRPPCSSCEVLRDIFGYDQ